MSYLEQIKGKHVEDLKNLLQDNLNLPDINNQFVGAIREELSNRGISSEISATDCGKEYIVSLVEVGIN